MGVGCSVGGGGVLKVGKKPGGVAGCVWDVSWLSCLSFEDGVVEGEGGVVFLQKALVVIVLVVIGYKRGDGRAVGELVELVSCFMGVSVQMVDRFAQWFVSFDKPFECLSEGMSL